MKKGNKNIIIAVVVLIIVFIVAGLLYLNNVKKYQQKYEPYAKKMETFGFNQRYNDEKTNDYKSVKKGEAIALVLSAVYNTNDITEIGYNPLFEDKNSAWVRYAEVEGVIPESSITKENVNKKVTMLEVITYLGKCKELFLDKELDTNVELKIKGTKKLSKEQINYLKDAVKMGIIENKGFFNANKKIKRGEFNKIVMDYMNQNLKTFDLGVEVETDNTLYPSNAIDYPYIAKGIDKSIYEIPFKNVEGKKIQKPNEVYSIFKNISTLTEETVKTYFDLLLNVDYKTINAEELKTKYKDLMQFFPQIGEVDSYVNFVKENKLVIKGNANPLWPIIYYDGDNYRVRTEVNFEVVSGNTNENILLGDLTSQEKTTYEKNNSFIVDVPLEYGISSHKLYSQFFNLGSAKVK